MKAIIASVGLMWMLVPQTAASEILLLGDVTPIYSLTALLPQHVHEAPTVRGNQDLFRRILGEKTNARVTILAGDGFPSQATFELFAFFGHEGVAVNEIEALEPESLAHTKLLVLGMPNFTWTFEDLTTLSSFLSNGGTMLIVVEPPLCNAACRKSTESLLKSVGTDLRVEDWQPGSEVGSGTQWGLPTDHELMRDIGPIAYGATFFIEGGTPLILETQGKSLLSVDTSISEEID